jgi:glycosyltransferase involved in cell wall biosynthesis
MSQVIKTLVHKLALIIRPLRVGIVSPFAFNLWFLTRPEANSPANGFSESKLQGLRALKRDLLASITPAESSLAFQGIHVWDSHPLIDLKFRRLSFLGINLVVITSITSDYFDQAFYVSRNPEVAHHNENPLSHYVVYGFFALIQPSDGVFNSRPEADWNMREQSHTDKKNYLWVASSERNLLVPTNFEALNSEAASLIAIADNDDSQASHFSKRIKSNSPASVSVIIPCFEQARFLEECLHSVAEATSEPHECIVVDDGNVRVEELSILKEVAAAAPHQRVVVHRQLNTGIAGARNAGLSIAQGKYVKFLDADDLITPGSIDLQINEMNATGTQADVGGYRVISDSAEVLAESIGPIAELPTTPDGRLDTPCLISQWEQGVALPIHSLLVQRDQLHATEAALRSKEDFRMWLELGANNTVFSTSPGVVALYRQHDKQMTSGSRARHGLYFLEALYDFAKTHRDSVAPDVLQSKIEYINDFYGSAPSKAWRHHSPARNQWLNSLGK